MGSFELQVSDEGGIAKRLWRKFKNERALALYSPFTVCLAAGTLDPKSFIHCISQDVYFLQAFAHAYELAGQYVDDEDDKEAIAELRKRVLKRFKNQDSLIREWGFEPPKDRTCDAATVKYTEFLAEAASGKVGEEKLSVKIVTPFEKTKLAAYTLSVISPCMRLYSFISKEIQARLDPDDAELAIITATNGSGPMPFEDIRTTWSDLFSQYVEEYQQCVESIIQDEAGTDKYLQAEGLDYEGLFKALKKISDFEKRANARLIHSNVLRGLNLSDIKRAGERLKFQDGCKKFFHNVVENKNCATKVHVLSYCWCSDLIRSAFSSGNLNVLNIHSNDLVYQESISTGGMIMKMECPIDKLQAFNDVTSNNHGRPLKIYIGGSLGDLLCLLEADIGIVIDLRTSLKSVANRFGVSFLPLFSGLISKQRELAESGSMYRKGMSSTLYTVSNWDEIYAFILGQ